MSPHKYVNQFVTRHRYRCIFDHWQPKNTRHHKLNRKRSSAIVRGWQLLKNWCRTIGGKRFPNHSKWCLDSVIVQLPSLNGKLEHRAFLHPSSWARAWHQNAIVPLGTKGLFGLKFTNFKVAPKACSRGQLGWTSTLQLLDLIRSKMVNVKVLSGSPRWHTRAILSIKPGCQCTVWSWTSWTLESNREKPSRPKFNS